MESTNQFQVPAGIDEAWDLLGNLPRVATCLPGATVDSLDGDRFTGHIGVRCSRGMPRTRRSTCAPRWTSPARWRSSGAARSPTSTSGCSSSSNLAELCEPVGAIGGSERVKGVVRSSRLSGAPPATPTTR